MLLLIGYDVGSSSIKATLLDVETGSTLASANSPEKELEIIAKKLGWVEQYPKTRRDEESKQTPLINQAIDKKIGKVEMCDSWFKSPIKRIFEVLNCYLEKDLKNQKALLEFCKVVILIFTTPDLPVLAKKFMFAKLLEKNKQLMKHILEAERLLRREFS